MVKTRVRCPAELLREVLEVARRRVSGGVRADGHRSGIRLHRRVYYQPVTTACRLRSTWSSIGCDVRTAAFGRRRGSLWRQTRSLHRVSVRERSQGRLPIDTTCRLLDLSSCDYDARVKRQVSWRAVADADAGSRGTPGGAPRIEPSWPQMAFVLAASASRAR